MEQFLREVPIIEPLQMDADTDFWLAGAAKWAKIISILGIIVWFASVISVIYYLNFSSYSGQLSQLPNRVIIFAVIAAAFVLFGIAIYLLYNFSVHTQKAIATQKDDHLDNAFNALKIFLILSASIGAVSIVVAISEIVELLNQ